MACQRGHEGTIIYFLEFLADPAVCNYEGMNAGDIVKSSAWYFNYNDYHQRKRRILAKLRKCKFIQKNKDTNARNCLVSFFS